MARVTLQFFENDANTVKVGVTDVRAEIFKSSTFCTADGTTTTTIPFAQRAGFGDGDHIYVGTSVSQTISDGTLPATGAGNVTVAGAGISFTNNDPIIRKRDVSVDAANDDYETVYDQEDRATPLTQPIDLDSDHEKSISVPGGAFGLRYFNNADGATLDIQNKVTFTWDDRRNAREFARSGAGTTGDPWILGPEVMANTKELYFPAGFYDFGTATVTGLSGQTLTGDGPEATVIRSSHTTSAFNWSGPGGDSLTIRDLSIDYRGTLIGYILRVNDFKSARLENVLVKASGSADVTNVATSALRFTDCAAVELDNVRVEGAGGALLFNIGLDIHQGASKGHGRTTVLGGRLLRCLTGARIGNSATVAVSGATFLGTRIEINDTTAQTTGTGIKCENIASGQSGLILAGVYINNYNLAVDLNNVDGFTLQSCRLAGFSAGTTPRGVYLQNSCRAGIISGMVLVNGSSAGTGFQLDASAHVGVAILPALMTNVATAITNATVGGSNNYIVSSTGIEVPEDDLTLTAGDLIITAGAETLTAGDLTLTAGDILVSAGTITTTAGVISGGGAISAVGAITGASLDVTTDVRGRGLIADGDVGAGIASTTILTNVTAANAGGAASLSGIPGGVSGTASDTWLKIWVGTTDYYIPLWG